MRALKFRAWEKVEKKMLFDADPFALYVSGSNEPLLSKEHRNEDCIFEQYTGLKDKNGEMIYEGDVVLDCYDGDDAFIVEWDKDTASFILTDAEHILNVSFDNFYPDKYLEIIGNIHENKELLEMRNNGRFSL